MSPAVLRLSYRAWSSGWRACALVGLIASALLLPASSANAAPGYLDPTFGQGGIVRTDFGSDTYSWATRVVVQRDGRAVAAGISGTWSCTHFCKLRIVAARYEPDGSLDPTFGDGGRVTIADDRIYNFGGVVEVALQSDGRILVLTTGLIPRPEGGLLSGYDLVRLRLDGSLDPTFGDGGRVILKFGEGERSISSNALALQPDGKILLSSGASGGLASAEVVRLTPDGSLDPTFGDGGEILVPFASALIVQGDGRIVVLANAGNGTVSCCHPVLSRYEPDGSPDPSFGTDGEVETVVGSTQASSFFASLLLQPDGDIVAAGTTDFGPVPGAWVLVRYRPDGRLDSGFGDGGIELTLFASGGFGPVGLVRQSNGRLVAAGGVYRDGPRPLGASYFALVRYNPDGSPDETFGGGQVLTPLSPDASGGLAIQHDGRLVVAGQGILPGGIPSFLLARYQGDPVKRGCGKVNAHGKGRARGRGRCK
jgi:uncharacterized delta-60 repeat protein